MAELCLGYDMPRCETISSPVTWCFLARTALWDGLTKTRRQPQRPWNLDSLTKWNLKRHSLTTPEESSKSLTAWSYKSLSVLPIFHRTLRLIEGSWSFLIIPQGENPHESTNRLTSLSITEQLDLVPFVVSSVEQSLNRLTIEITYDQLAGWNYEKVKERRIKN